MFRFAVGAAALGGPFTGSRYRAAGLVTQCLSGEWKFFLHTFSFKKKCGAGYIFCHACHTKSA